MSSEDFSDFFRAFGRLEAQIASVENQLADLRTQLRESHTRRWTAWAGAISALVCTIMSGVMLSHMGIKN